MLVEVSCPTPLAHARRGIGSQAATSWKEGATAMQGSLALRPENDAPTELAQAGFTEEEATRLRELKREYPFIEYVDSGRQWQRLLFLKWRYEQGDLKRD
jgi:hypothetical protein